MCRHSTKVEMNEDTVSAWTDDGVELVTIRATLAYASMLREANANKHWLAFALSTHIAQSLVRFHCVFSGQSSMPEIMQIEQFKTDTRFLCLNPISSPTLVSLQIVVATVTQYVLSSVEKHLSTALSSKWNKGKEMTYWRIVAESGTVYPGMAGYISPLPTKHEDAEPDGRGM